MSMLPIIKYASKSFTLPDTCIQLRQILDDPRSSMQDMAQVMSVDPSLSAKVLRLSNSSLFRFSEQVTSIPKALSIIGGEAAYNISMAETANLAFKSFSTSTFDFAAFWEKSVRTGVIARSIAQQKQERGSERFFVMGILMHLSELVCATKLESKYKQYINRDNVLLPLEAQRQVFGFTFSSCSGQIMENWRLPENLYNSIAMLSLFEKQQLGKDESILYMAATMAELNEGASILENPQIKEQVIQTLDLNHEDYDMIFGFAQSETSKIAQALN